MSYIWLMLPGCFSPDIGCTNEDGDEFGYGRCNGDTEPRGADGDATVYPGADELCDGKDNDLDELVDEGQPDADDDGDADCTDCAPADAAIGVNAVEQANGEDDDCDGEIDEGAPAAVWVESIQDLVRAADTQTIHVRCEPCTDTPVFAITRQDEEDPGTSIEIERVEVIGASAFVTLTVDRGAALGFYDLSWEIAGNTDTIEEAVRLARGQVRILDISSDVLLLGHDDRLPFYLEGWNFDWAAVITVADDSGQSVACEVDTVEPDRIDCHFDDTQWSLAEGTAVLSVRDSVDEPDCAGYSQDCYDGPVLEN